MSFEEDFEQDKKEYKLGSGDWFKFKEGDNKMRIMADPKIIIEKFKVGIYYEGCGYDEKFPNDSKSVKYLTWIIDRADHKLKLFKMPYKLTQQLVALKKEGDFAFEKFPMPYDINIKAENAGSTKVTYTLFPAKKETPVSESDLEEFGKLTIPESIIAKMKMKQMQKDGIEPPKSEKLDTVEYPDEEVDPDAIPF